MISDVLAAPQATLDQGPGAAGIARIVAGEWQRDGYLKPGTIVSVRRLTTEEFLSDIMGFEAICCGLAKKGSDG
jgi:hypothetical protein